MTKNKQILRILIVCLFLVIIFFLLSLLIEHQNSKSEFKKNINAFVTHLREECISENIENINAQIIEACLDKKFTDAKSNMEKNN